MFATMNVNQPPTLEFEQFRRAMDSLSNLFARQKSPTIKDKVSTNFAAVGQPLSPETLREVERLELAIRQGSINA